MTSLAPEAAALRAEGLAAAREMLPASACPYATDDWRRFDWAIGHASFTRRPSQRELKVANTARLQAKQREKAAARRREKAATPAPSVPPEARAARPTRHCELASCDARLSRKQRRYCCWEHYVEADGLAEAAKAGRVASMEAGAARVAAAAKRAIGLLTAQPVTPEMWRAVYGGETEGAMRCMGLDKDQIARVLRLQRRGARGAA